MESIDREKVIKAVYKRAVGFKTKESVDELSAGEEGDLTLVKRKITVKEVPGDIQAAKLLLSLSGGDFSALTDEELYTMRDELLAELKQ